MFHRIVVISILLALAVAAAAAVDEKKLSEGGITVSYPAGMEAQAKKVMQIAKQSIKPSLDQHRRSSALLANSDTVAKSIVTLLGADEKLDETQDRLKGYKDRSDAFIKCFGNIRLVKKTAAAGAGGVDGGLLKVEYVKDSDEFKMTMEGDLTDAEKLKKCCYPVIVNPDGSIRAENKIAEVALKFLGTGETIAIAPVHETVGYILAEQLKLYHPFARWFNDGVAGWVANAVISKSDPKLGSSMSKFLAVSAFSKNMKEKVNLLAWPQPAFQNRAEGVFDPSLDAVHTQYAVELITNLLGKDGSTLLPKIMGELNYTGNPDTDTICKAIDKMTGKNSKTLLLGYVPKQVRDGIDSGEAKSLGAEAEKLVAKNDFAGAAANLRLALEMAPEDVNLRLNYACAERETGERRDSEFQVFAVASLLKKGNQSFHLYETSGMEGCYVLARLAVLVGNLEQAREFIQPLIQAKPNHADAKHLVDEIDKLQKSAKGS